MGILHSCLHLILLPSNQVILKSVDLGEMLSFAILLPVELLRKHHIFMNVDFLCSNAVCSW